MRWRERAALAAVSAVTALALAGCSGGFMDYDVSGYFQALLDSSYLGQNENYMTVAATTEEGAQQNNATTVENAAVNFCNTYGLSPSDQQLTQLEDVMRQAFLQADYTVKDEQKVDTGYYLEVEINPIVNFSGIESEIQQLRSEAQDEATEANSSASSGVEDSSQAEGGDETAYGQESSGEEGSSSASEGGQEPVDANTLFVDKVIAFCQGELGNIRYGGEPVTIALDIRQTGAGELQLDTNQLDTIDRTVLQFQN